MSRSLLGLATRDQRPNLHYDIIEPTTRRSFPPNPSTGWRYSREKMEQLVAGDCILFPKNNNGRPREKKFRKDMQAEFIAFRSVIGGRSHRRWNSGDQRLVSGGSVFVPEARKSD